VAVCNDVRAENRPNRALVNATAFVRCIIYYALTINLYAQGLLIL
jgi:hypothetical protein